MRKGSKKKIKRNDRKKRMRKMIRFLKRNSSPSESLNKSHNSQKRLQAGRKEQTRLPYRSFLSHLVTASLNQMAKLKLQSFSSWVSRKEI